jgi:hypothetical protein
MLSDTARFRPTDPDPLVSASLACPICLRADTVAWNASLAGHDPSIECRCAGCDVDWRLFLQPHQALRIALMPHRRK